MKQADIKFEFIITYNDREQDFVVSNVPSTYMKSKEKFAEYITRPIANPDELAKISCCAYDVDKDLLPDWYFNCDGKLYF